MQSVTEILVVIDDRAEPGLVNLPLQDLLIDGSLQAVHSLSSLLPLSLPW